MLGKLVKHFCGDCILSVRIPIVEYYFFHKLSVQFCNFYYSGNPEVYWKLNWKLCTE